MKVLVLPSRREVLVLGCGWKQWVYSAELSASFYNCLPEIFSAFYEERKLLFP
jgi:hypothetical protein